MINPTTAVGHPAYVTAPEILGISDAYRQALSNPESQITSLPVVRQLDARNYIRPEQQSVQETAEVARDTLEHHLRKNTPSILDIRGHLFYTQG